jgi:hypothetical protein
MGKASPIVRNARLKFLKLVAKHCQESDAVSDVNQKEKKD